MDIDTVQGPRDVRRHACSAASGGLLAFDARA
jgi:hypothetical protein